MINEKKLLMAAARKVSSVAHQLKIDAGLEDVKTITKYFQPPEIDNENLPSVGVYFDLKESGVWVVKFGLHEIVRIQESLETGRYILEEGADNLITRRLKRTLETIKQ